MTSGQRELGTGLHSIYPASLPHHRKTEGEAAFFVADWLVTRDGTRIETEGLWSMQGKLVVFELPDGTLSSLRLSLVASDRATAEAEAEPA